MEEEQYMKDTAWQWSLPNITFHKIISCRWRCSTFGRLGTRKSWSLYNWKAVVRREKMSVPTKPKESSRALGLEPRWKFPRRKSGYCSSQYLMELRQIFENKTSNTYYKLHMLTFHTFCNNKGHFFAKKNTF